jgi:hypothetical protein
VIGTGAHVFTVRRLLAEVRRRSERPPAETVEPGWPRPPGAGRPS